MTSKKRVSVFASERCVWEKESRRRGETKVKEKDKPRKTQRQIGVFGGWNLLHEWRFSSHSSMSSSRFVWLSLLGVHQRNRIGGTLDGVPVMFQHFAIQNSRNSNSHNASSWSPRSQQERFFSKQHQQAASSKREPSPSSHVLPAQTVRFCLLEQILSLFQTHWKSSKSRLLTSAS